MKKTLFLAIVAIVTLVGCKKDNENEVVTNIQVDGIEYKLDDNELTASVIYNYEDKYIGSVIIPSTVSCGGKTYSVTTIGEYAFEGCTGLTSVTIPNSVTTIGHGAFRGCSGLTSVTIPNSVTTIGEWAFSGCSGLTSLTISNLVTEIERYTFSGCSGLTFVTIPNSVKTIRDHAFEGCTGLTSVNIPNSVTMIEENAFLHVMNVVYSGTAPGSPWGAKCINGYIDGYLVYSDATKTKLCGCFTNATGEITIPNSVTTIGSYAFDGCSGLTSVTIPNSVKTIGDNAFASCSGLTSVTIGNSVTSIGEKTFYECTGLTSVTIPNSVTRIGNYAFLRVNNIVYDGTATGSPWGAKCINGYIDGYLVYSDANKTILCGCSSATIGEITIPNSVTKIGKNAFDGCTGMTSVTIGNSVTEIGYDAFSSCSGLTKTNYTGTIAGWCKISFDYHANPMCYSHNFYINDVEVKDLVIPAGVTTIRKSAFHDCSGLTSVTIGNSVKTIGEEAFYNCSGLISITCYATNPPTCGYYCFSNVDTSIPVYVPAGCMDVYKNAERWKVFTNFCPI